MTWACTSSHHAAWRRSSSVTRTIPTSRSRRSGRGRSSGEHDQRDRCPVSPARPALSEGMGARMDMRYQAFCVADSDFYDSSAGWVGERDRFIGGRTVPQAWRCQTKQAWTVLVPPIGNAPTQGWKIHASATVENAGAVLDRVWDYCVHRNIPFQVPERSPEPVAEQRQVCRPRWQREVRHHLPVVRRGTRTDAARTG